MSIVLVGSSSGSITLQEPAVAGTTVLDLPATSGTVVVTGTTPTLNGITFPATQAPSADANTLDDYEEGTWTPNQGSQLTVVGTFSSSGTYIKIGKQVTVWGVLSGSTSVAYNSNAVITSNLPFTVTGFCVGSAVNNANTAGTFLNPSSSTIYSSSAMAATPNIPFTATYITSA
jgi:hypothetical protein